MAEVLGFEGLGRAVAEGRVQVARVIEAWRQHYNRERPHSALASMIGSTI